MHIQASRLLGGEIGLLKGNCVILEKDNLITHHLGYMSNDL